MSDDPSPVEQQKVILEELQMLSSRQSEALQRATYIRMSNDEARQYDERAQRVKELCGLIKNFRAA